MARPPSRFATEAAEIAKKRAAAAKKKKTGKAAPPPQDEAQPDLPEAPPIEAYESEQPSAEVLDIREARKRQREARFTRDARGAEFDATAGDEAQVYQAIRNRLARNDNGGVYPTHANLLTILRLDPKLTGLVVRDEFGLCDIVTRAPPEIDDTDPLSGPYPRPYSDADTMCILAYLQVRWARGFKLSHVHECVGSESGRLGFHPVCRWLAGLEWDGKARLDLWLTHTFGVKADAYHKAVGSMTLIAAVRRVRRPGVKFDNVLIIEGIQGSMKSTAVGVLFTDDWFSDQISDISKKDACQELAGKWCIELGEIVPIIKADKEVAKAFLSRRVDHYRPTYGRRAIDIPRQNIFIGTTNETAYLNDPTGNRRYWPVSCLTKAADIQWLRENREQLWAEAAHREAQHEAIFMDNQSEAMMEATAAQSGRMIEESWSERVLHWANNPYPKGEEAPICDLDGNTLSEYRPFKHVTTTLILLNACDVPVKDHDRARQMRVADIMKTAGWANIVKRYQGKLIRVWQRQDADGEDEG